MAVYSRSDLIGVTYISHSLTDSLIHWPMHNILDAPTKRYFFYKKITQKWVWEGGVWWRSAKNIPANSHTLHVQCMHESHACGSKIVISRIQTNFSCLTDTTTNNQLYNQNKKCSECNWLKAFKKSSEHLRKNSWGWLELNPLEILGPVLKWSKIFLHFRLSLEVVEKSLALFGSRRNPLVNLWKFGFCEDEKSHSFYWKKLAGRVYTRKSCALPKRQPKCQVRNSADWPGLFERWITLSTG